MRPIPKTLHKGPCAAVLLTKIYECRFVTIDLPEHFDPRL